MLDNPAYNDALLESSRNWSDYVYTGRQDWDQLIDGKKRVREGGGVGDHDNKRNGEQFANSEAQSHCAQ